MLISLILTACSDHIIKYPVPVEDTAYTNDTPVAGETDGTYDTSEDEVLEEDTGYEEPIDEEEDVIEDTDYEDDVEEPVEDTAEEVVEEPEDEPVEEDEPEEIEEEEIIEEEVVEEEPEEEYDYISMTKVDLVELAKKRGLPVSGTKKKIIARLEEND